MRRSKQTHIFATKPDLVPGLSRIEAELGVRYARCGSYAGSIFEQYSSLLAWNGLGENTTGDHVTGPQFLVVPKSQKINIELAERAGGWGGTARGGDQEIIVVDALGQLSRPAVSLDNALDLLDGAQTAESQPKQLERAYVVSQKLNPDSVVFSPGGVYKPIPAVIAGHIGTISESKIAVDLYKNFVKAITNGFEKIGSYHVGADAARLMVQGYRMVTISITSPAIYDLKRR